MKFTKDELSAALMAKLTLNGKSLSMSKDKTFPRMVERIYQRLEKQGNDEELDNVVAEYLPDFEDIEGNLRHDNSAFIKDWEKQHGNKPKDEPKHGEPDGLSELEKLQKQVQELLDRQKAQEVAKSVADKKAAIIAKLKGEKVDNADWLNGQMELVNVTADTDVDGISAKLLALYNQSVVKDASVATPGQAGGEAPNEEHEFDDIAAAMQE